MPLRNCTQAPPGRILSAEPAGNVQTRSWFYRPQMPFVAGTARPGPPCEARSCCHRAATKIKARPPSPAIRPLTCCFLVAGAGFEPATSGL